MLALINIYPIHELWCIVKKKKKNCFPDVYPPSILYNLNYFLITDYLKTVIW